MIRNSQLKIENQQNIGKRVSQFDTFGKCERPFYFILRWDKLTLNHKTTLKSDIPVYIDGKGRGLFLLFLFIPL